MQILLTGASGFLGSHLAGLMKAHGLDFRALVRPTSKTEHLLRLGVECRAGDLRDMATIEKAMKGSQAAIHLAAAADVSSPKTNHEVNVRGVSNLIVACQATGAKRILFLSSTCAERKYRDAYGQTKLEGEHLLQRSGLAVTILRPTMIYGAGSKEFSTFVNVIRRFPVVPLIGPGTFHIRPVYIEDVLPAIINGLLRDVCIGRTYDIAGPEPVSFNNLVLEVASLLKRPRVLLHLPSGPCLAFSRMLGSLVERPPITVDQVMAFLQDTEVNIAAAERDLDFRPRRLSEGLPRVLADMGFHFSHSRSN